MKNRIASIGILIIFQMLFVKKNNCFSKKDASQKIKACTDATIACMKTKVQIQNSLMEMLNIRHYLIFIFRYT